MTSKSLGLSTKVVVILGATLAGFMAFWALQPDDHKGMEKSIDIRREDIRTIQVRLLSNQDLDQTESGFLDVTCFADLIVDLLFPSESSPMKKSAYPAVCELSIEEKSGLKHHFGVIWPGKGKLVIANHSRLCYRRTGPYKSLGKEKYVDEPAAFCGMIQGIRRHDKSEIDRFSTLLRKSMGKPKDE